MAGTAAYLAAPAIPLRVLRATPANEAARSATIAPYSFGFRVKGPVLVSGTPASPTIVPHYVTPTSGFALVYDGPVQVEALPARASLEMDASCSAARTIRLVARSQRRADAARFRHARHSCRRLRRRE